MSVRCLGCGLQYAGAKGPRGLFARPPSPRYLATLAHVPVFHRRARALLAGDANPTLGEFLRRGRYTPHFVRHFVVPLVSAVWSCGPEVVAEYPARYLFVFLEPTTACCQCSGSPDLAHGDRRFPPTTSRPSLAKELRSRCSSANSGALAASAQSDGVSVLRATDGRAAVVRRGRRRRPSPTRRWLLLDELTPWTSATLLGAIPYSDHDTAQLHTDDIGTADRHRGRAGHRGTTW